jgi:hypothetical protein
MKLVKPLPFKEAIEKVGSKTIVGSQLNSAEWSEVPLVLRERAFFSSRVESARFLQRAQDAIGDFLAGNREDAPDPEDGTMLKMGSRQQFVRDMQAFAIAEGMGSLPGDGTAGTLQDISSEKRLSLIFDVQTRQGQDFGYWKQGMDADVLNEFPAQRFIRTEEVHEPRDWHKLFEDGVWLKTDLDAWIRINVDFGVPWGPWGWGCGHDVEDVDRDEAEELGLIEPGTRPEPADTRFNERLEASARGLQPELLQQLRNAFGDKVVIEGDAIRWRVEQEQTEKAEPKPKPKKPKPEKDLPQKDAKESNEETATARLDQALEAAGVKGKEKVTAAEMTALREELKELAPAKAQDVIATMHGKQHGTLTKANMQQEVQQFLDLLPPSLVAKLPKLHLEANIFDANGDYRMGGRVRAHVKLNHDAEETHRVLFHELMHWVHLEGPQWYRDTIAKHFEARTAGEKLGYLPGYGLQGKQDKWYEVYAGRVYSGYPAGTEVPTRFIEWLTFSAEKMAKMWNDPVTRETLLIVLRILF